jgi:hypothetical protein
MKNSHYILFQFGFWCAVISGCDTLTAATPAALDTLTAICESGLLKHPAVVEQAESLNIEPKGVAQYLCAIPAVVSVFKHKDSGTADRAVTVAQQKGALP